MVRQGRRRPLRRHRRGNAGRDRGQAHPRPHAHISFETGGIGPLPEELPMAVADPRVMAFSNLNAGLVEAFSYVADRRPHTIAFLGAALTEAPTAEELRILRDDVDPQRLILG
jgi:hypothetical protein